MRKSRLLFITQNLAIGGGTSSLSALFSIIKNRYDISVFLLTSQGQAKVSYQNRIIRSKSMTDLYYRDYSSSKGFKRFFSFFVKLYYKILHFFGVNVEKAQVNCNMRSLSGFDVIISYGEGAATSFAQYISYCPKVAWIHYEISKEAYSQDFLKLYSNFNYIITVSEVIANGLKAIYPELAERVVGIHNIIDIQRIKMLSNEDIPDYFDDKFFNIISIGRLSPVKRFSEIPHIVSRIRNSNTIKWRILGPEASVSEKNTILNNIGKYEVADTVGWLGNKVNPYPYLKKSDLLVILSSSEACPMVITEARALNVPIISTDYTTSVEFINNNVDGVIRPLNEIAKAIETLIADRQQYIRLKRNSALRRNDNDESIQRFNSMIDSVLS